MKTTIYLVRHAEAEGNAQEFFQGNINTALTSKGEQQLTYLAERFRDIPLDAVYVSPYQRTIQTAEAVNRYHKLPLIQENDLREIGGGDWEGKRWSELPTLFPEAYRLWTEEMWHFRAPNGEPITDVFSRMTDTLRRIAEQHFGQTIAVISHGCALRNFLCAVEFQDITRLKDVGWADNTAVSCVTYDTEQGWTLVFKNDSTHLPPECSTLRTSKWCRYETQKDSQTR